MEKLLKLINTIILAGILIFLILIWNKLSHGDINVTTDLFEPLDVHVTNPELDVNVTNLYWR